MFSLPVNEVEIFHNGKWEGFMFTEGSFESVKSETLTTNEKYWKLPKGTKARYKGQEFNL